MVVYLHHAARSYAGQSNPRAKFVSSGQEDQARDLASGKAIVTAGRNGKAPSRLDLTMKPAVTSVFHARLLYPDRPNVAYGSFASILPCPVHDRGRDGCYQPPPAQIRACGIPAHGSHLGCVTAKLLLRLAVCDRAPVTRLTRFCARSVLCWFAFPLAPALRSTGSATDRSALFVGFSATMAGSDFSRPCIIGYGSSPSRCGPAAVAERSIARSPGSRAQSVRTCQGLRPRRAVWVLAMSRPSVLPSVSGTTSAPGRRVLSRLNGWPVRSPADASPSPSRVSTHGLGPRWFRCTFLVVDLHPLLLAGLPAHSD